MNMLSKIVSIVFGFPWIPALIMLIVFQDDILLESKLILLALVFFLMIVIPFGYLLYALKKGTISNYDVTKREERKGIMGLLLLMSFISLGVTYYFDAIMTFEFLSIVFMVLLTNYVITLYWKISLHMGINVVGSILVNAVLGWQYPILFLSIPIIYWSRTKLHRHTPAQLVAGLLVSGGITLTGLWYFGHLQV